MGNLNFKWKSFFYFFFFENRKEKKENPDAFGSITSLLSNNFNSKIKGLVAKFIHFFWNKRLDNRKIHSKLKGTRAN